MLRNGWCNGTQHRCSKHNTTNSRGGVRAPPLAVVVSSRWSLLAPIACRFVRPTRRACRRRTSARASGALSWSLLSSGPGHPVNTALGAAGGIVFHPVPELKQCAPEAESQAPHGVTSLKIVAYCFKSRPHTLQNFLCRLHLYPHWHLYILRVFPLGLPVSGSMMTLRFVPQPQVRQVRTCSFLTTWTVDITG